jgi:hypothetical protein
VHLYNHHGVQYSGASAASYILRRLRIRYRVQPTPTPTPTLTLTLTPHIWQEGEVFLVRPDSPMPRLPLPDGSNCPSSQEFANLPASQLREANINCATITINRYHDQYGGQMTWAHFVALLMYVEGNAVLLGRRDPNAVSGIVYDNPQIAYRQRYNNGATCYRIENASGSYLSGEAHCVNGVQRHFPMAVIEWLFNECAKSVGFPSGVYVRPDGTPYDGTCNLTGIHEYIKDAHGLYSRGISDRDPADADLYLPLARERLNLIRYEVARIDGDQYMAYGECPCSWGNVQTETDAKKGYAFSSHAFSYFHNPAWEGIYGAYFTVR